MKSNSANLKKSIAVGIVAVMAMTAFAGMVSANTSPSSDIGEDENSKDVIKAPIESIKHHIVIHSKTPAKIYWDDYHDTDGDSLAPGGNYEYLADELRSAGHTIHEKTVPITLTSLLGYDVLLIQDPEDPLSTSEISAIQTWVDQGHGLFVVGERESCFNDESVNVLLAPYKISIPGDITPDVADRFNIHPVTEGVGTLGLYACGYLTVSSPSIKLGYANTDEVVLAAYESTGRVVVFSDSSPLKNDYIYTYDEVTFVLNTIDWLSATGDDDDTFSFSVLGTGDYITSSDLNNWDADLTYIIAELLGDVDQNERDASVEPNDFYDEDAGANPPGADVSDLLYFTGHGSPGKVWLCDGTKEYSLDYNDIEANSDGWDLDLEWAIFATCSTLKDDGWKNVLTHGTHTLCGYDGVTLDYVDTYIIYRFFELTALHRLPIVDSWKYANLLVGEGDWKCIFHEGNRNDHLWGFGSVGPDYTGTEDIIIYKTASQKSAIVFNENLANTIELAKLSDEREIIPSLISVTPSFREMKETFNYFGLDEGKIKEMKFRDEKAYYATDNAHTAIVYPSGATIYFASHSEDGSSRSSISKQTAIAIAEKFVEEHDGLPPDSYLENVLPVVQIKDGSTSVDGFIVKYSRKYDDRKVCGYAGDGMMVEVDAKGNVRYFYKLWRNIAGISERDYVIISAKECLEKALPQIQQLIKGDRYSISNMELVYYSKPFSKEQREIIPAWKIDIADTQGRADDYVFVDATSGKLIIP